MTEGDGDASSSGVAALVMNPPETFDKHIPITRTVSDLSEVESALSQLYGTALNEDSSIAPTVRALLLNLIAYSGQPGGADVAMDAVARISGSHPCRAVVVDASLRASGHPVNTVSVICGITDRGDRRLCGEVVRVSAGGHLGLSPGAVLPLLAPDVPVFLWVLGDLPLEDAGFDAVADVADAVLLDSRAFSDLLGGFERAQSLMRGAPASRIVRDLAWVSMHWWRELTAQHFDPPSARKYAAAISEITIRHSIEPGSALLCPPAVLFASWLASRFGLRANDVKIDEDGVLRIGAAQNGHSVNVAVVPDSNGSRTGDVTSVAIRCELPAGAGESTEPATFLTQSVSANEVSISQECEGFWFPARIVDVGTPNTHALLSEALDMPWRFGAFEEAIAFAIDILARLKR